jgi:hypothetical protein
MERLIGGMSVEGWGKVALVCIICGGWKKVRATVI